MTGKENDLDRKSGGPILTQKVGGPNLTQILWAKYLRSNPRCRLLSTWCVDLGVVVQLVRHGRTLLTRLQQFFSPIWSKIEEDLFPINLAFLWLNVLFHPWRASGARIGWRWRKKKPSFKSRTPNYWCHGKFNRFLINDAHCHQSMQTSDLRDNKTHKRLFEFWIARLHKISWDCCCISPPVRH